MTEVAKILDLDAMLDETLDNVEDLPDFLNPPDGLYVMAIDDAKTEKYEDKTTKEKRSRIRITHKVVSTVEVKEGELPVPDGSLCSESFTGTEQGIEYFKKAAKGYLGVKDLDGVPLRDILASLKGAEYKARIVNVETPSKDDSTKVYTNLRINVMRTAPAAE